MTGGSTITRVVVASDKFKGSLSAGQVGDAVRRGLRQVRPDVDVAVVPVADGGDGTLDAAVAAGHALVPLHAAGPTGDRLPTAYARLGDQAVIELAHICGLLRLPDAALAPWTSTTRGVGEVIAAALDAGCRHLVLGIGGSASTDGGAGMLLALGARLLDATGSTVPDPGARLDVVAELDLDGLHPALRDSDIVLACDVDNPLTGARGAAAAYGRQKGLTQPDIPIVDAHLKKWADVMSAATGRDHRNTPGAGAAGGVGFAAIAALNAQMRPGIQLVLELVHFHEHLADADLVITGEGSLDEQTLAGKAPAGVAAAAAEAGVEVVAICGRRELNAEQLRAMGVTASYALQDIEKDPALCVANAYPLLCTLAKHIGLVHLGSAPS